MLDGSCNTMRPIDMNLICLLETAGTLAGGRCQRGILNVARKKQPKPRVWKLLVESLIWVGRSGEDRLLSQHANGLSVYRRHEVVALLGNWLENGLSPTVEGSRGYCLKGNCFAIRPCGSCEIGQHRSEVSRDAEDLVHCALDGL